MTARDAALADATSAKERCNMAEAEMKALREEQADQTRRLQEREEELNAQEVALSDHDAKLAQAARTKLRSGTAWAS